MIAATRWSLVLAALSMALPMLSGASSAEAPEKPQLTIDRIYSLPHLIGTAPGGFAWSADGRYLAFLWNEAGFNFRDVWMMDVEDPELVPTRMTSMPQSDRPDPAAFENPLALAEAEETWERDSGVTAVIWHPDGKNLLVTFGGDFWLVTRGATPQRLTHTTAPERRAAYSPDGRTLAFLRDGDLWFLTSELSEVQRTDIAEPDLGAVDFRWSPDGSHIAILEMDERDVSLRGIPDYLAEETALTEVRRAYPGEAPGMQRLGVIVSHGETATSEEIHWMDWGANEPDMLLSYRWSPGGRQIAIDTSDLYAKDRQIFVVDVEDDPMLTPRRVVRDLDPENETFYYWRIEWSTDSRFLYFLSDREEDYHVWSTEPSGDGQPQQLTSGAWAVAEMFPVEGGLIVVGNRGKAEERHLFRVGNSGGEAAKLSQRPGTHAPTVSPDGRWAAVHFSSQSTPAELLLTSLALPAGTEAGRFKDPAGAETGHDQDPAGAETNLADVGEALAASREGASPFPTRSASSTTSSATTTEPGRERERQVTHSPIPEFQDYEWVEAQFVTFPSHIDGTTLYGRLTLPPDFDPDKTYPAILGSVYTDSVRNQWGGRTAHPTWGLDQYLSQEGYILLNVDMRGSWGRGREHRRGIRLDYGGMDIEDLESGVRFLGTLGHVDLDRVGIWGSSYGGLMTAMSLFRKPGLYAAGIAGAPATNVWHALTGQMAVMMRPQDQAEEYADSSPFMHAHGLEDPLMIIHGMRDWVVLFKDSVILVQRLILLGKDVELVALPNSGHGWDNEGLAQTRFAFHKMIRFFDRHLQESCEEPEGEPHEPQ